MIKRRDIADWFIKSSHLRAASNFALGEVKILTSPDGANFEEWLLCVWPVAAINRNCCTIIVLPARRRLVHLSFFVMPLRFEEADHVSPYRPMPNPSHGAKCLVCLS